MTFSLSETAARKILYLIQEEKSTATVMFRIMISSGGCSGFQYSLSFDDQVNEDDHIFEDKGVKVIVDAPSLPFIEGAEIDYTEELIGSSFVVKNPNAATSCGCGNSFSV